MITIFSRTIIIYFVLIVSVRLMGKRQIGELQISEFIVTLLLSEIASEPLTDRSIPLIYAVIPILLLLSLEVIISFALIKNNKLKRLFYGSPTVIIKKGKILQKEMSKNRLEIDELISELRQKGYSDISEVNYAIIEENGKLSVFPKADKSPPKAEDLAVKVRETGIAHVCVIDGCIIKKNLELSGMTEKALYLELSKRNIDLSDVFVLTSDDCGSINVVRKEKSK